MRWVVGVLVTLCLLLASMTGYYYGVATIAASLAKEIIGCQGEELFYR